MKNSFKFFENRECKYFPCHENAGESFNCLFCYCPMYFLESCPGSPEFIKGRDGKIIKDCSGCTFPHEPENYENVIKILAEGNVS